MNKPTAEQVREVLDYDAETGIFTWKVRLSIRVPAVGAPAGTKTKVGYLQGAIRGYRTYMHRLAWVWMTGEWPANHIDHINGDRSDNRWTNLRDVTRSVNLQNQRKAAANSSTKLLGAHPFQGRFKAEIGVNGKSRHIGCFATAEEAHAAYVAAKREFHAGCTI